MVCHSESGLQRAGMQFYALLDWLVLDLVSAERHTDVNDAF